MSTLVDERVVELSFDNSNFEKNTKQTMNTLDTFKKSLDFSGVSKSVNDSISNITMDPITYGIEQAKQSFDAWEVVAISVISNISNRITNLGIQMIESLSVDNISSGWMKYSENVKSVGTLLSQDGNTIEDVNGALEKLMWFTDQTSYSYTDMVSNIGKFTATGQNLEDSVQAMMGIANWAALSGQNAATASRAMYQLSQAMGQGTVKLMDYKSIQNANMDTKEFRENALNTAVAMGYLVKSYNEQGEALYTTTEKALEAGKSFNQSQFTTQLSAGWFSSDVLMKTLERYSSAVDKLYEDTAVNGYYDTAAEAIKAYEKELETAGTEEEKFGIKAFKSAQEARTFEDAINATKDAVSSGWLSTFDKIFGDYDESKQLWTDLADELWEVFAASGATRNSILSIWKDLEGRNDIFDKETGAFWNLFYSIKSIVDIVKEAWQSIFGLGRAFDENQTYEQKAAESLKSFTERLRDSTTKLKNFIESISGDLKNALRGAFSILKVITKSIGAVYTGFKPLLSLFSGESKSALKTIGDLGDSFANWVESTDLFSKVGKTLFDTTTSIVNSFKELRIVERIIEIFKVFKESFKSVTKETNSGKRIIDGLISVLDIFMGAIKFVARLLGEVILPLVSTIAKFVSSIGGKLIGYVVRFIANIAELITSLVNFLKTNEKFQNGINKVFELLKKIPSIFVPLLPLFKGLGNILLNLLEIIVELPKALAKLVQKVSGSSIGDVFRILGETITSAVKAIANALSGFKNVDSDGIDEFTNDVTPKVTPLQALFEGLKNLFEGLFNVIKAIMPVVGAVFQLIGQGLNWIANLLKNSFGNDSPFEIVQKIFSVAFWTVVIDYLYQMLYVFKTFISSFGMIFEGVANYIDSKAMMQYSQAMKTFAIAILLITASLILLSSMKTEELAKALSVLTIIVTGMVAVMKAFNKMFASSMITSFKKGIFGFADVFRQSMAMKAAGALMLEFAAAIIILTIAMKMLSKMSSAQLATSLLALISLVSILVIVSMILSNQKRIMQRGALSLIIFAIAIRLLVKPIKLLGKMDEKDIAKGLKAIVAIMAIFIAVGKLFKMKSAPALTVFAANLILLSVGLTILSGTLAILSKINPGKAWSSVGIIAALMAIFIGISKLVKIADAGKLAVFSVSMMLFGAAIASISASIVILSALPYGKVWNSVGAIVAFTAVMALIIKLVGIFSSLKLMIFAAGMIELGKAMAIFAAVIVILGTMEEDALKRGRKTIELFILAMIGIIKLVGIFSSLKLSVFAAGMILLGVAMMQFAMVISILSSIESGSLWKGIGAITAFIAAIIVLSKFTSIGSSVGLVTLGTALISIGLGMTILAGSLALLGNIPWQVLLLGFGVLIATIGGLVVVSKLLGPSVIILLALGAALTLIATAVLTFAAALTLLVGLGSAAGLVIATLVGGLVDAIIGLGPKLTEAITTIVTSIISALATSLTKIFTLLDGLLSNIISLIKNRGPEIITTVMLLLTTLLQSLAENMPKIAKSLMEILVALLDALKDVAGRIIQDVLDILFALLDKLIENVPVFMEKIGALIIALIDGAVQTIVNLIPRLVNAAFDLVLGLIEGLGQAIEDNAARVRETIINFCNHIINAFLKFFGMKDANDNSKVFESTGKGLIGGLFGGFFSQVTGFISKVINFAKKIIDAFKTGDFTKLGKAIIQGIWNGIKSIWTGFVNFWKSIWEGIKNFFCNLFGIHSPSRLFYQYGQNTVEGYQNGLDDGQNGIYDSMENIKDNADEIWSEDAIYDQYGKIINRAISDALIDNSGIIYETINQMITDSLNIISLSKQEFKDIIHTILDIIQSDINENVITIKPVIDYSEIIEGSSLIAGMLSSVGAYNITGSTKLAEQTSNDISNSKKSTSLNNSANNTASGNAGENYNVNFNIYGISDPDAVADTVNKKLQDFVYRRKHTWE